MSILESIKFPEIILTVKAVDLDPNNFPEEKEKGFGVVKYSLIGGNSNLFTIDADTGAIQVKNTNVTAFQFLKILSHRSHQVFDSTEKNNQY